MEGIFRTSPPIDRFQTGRRKQTRLAGARAFPIISTTAARTDVGHPRKRMDPDVTLDVKSDGAWGFDG